MQLPDYSLNATFDEFQNRTARVLEVRYCVSLIKLWFNTCK